MTSPLDAVVTRLTAITDVVASAARMAAAGMAVAAAVAVAVITLPTPAGFGRSGAGWWVAGAALLVPAIVVYLFSRSAGRLGGVAAVWQEQLEAAAAEAADGIGELASAVQATVTQRRGIRRLVGGVWGLRRIVRGFGDLTGAVAPAVALSPGALGATGLAVLAGLGVTGLAALLLVVRIVA